MICAWLRAQSGFIRRSRGLKDVGGRGELPGAPGEAAEFSQDVPGFELGAAVGAFAKGAELGVGTVGVLL